MQNRLRTVLLTLFALTALSLAALGSYSTLSYVIDLRRREVGLRLALGAPRSSILRRLAGQGLRAAAAGCACLALLSTRARSGMLFGISATDPATLSAVVILVLAVATLAALIPATRAALTQPMRTLREE